MRNKDGIKAHTGAYLIGAGLAVLSAGIALLLRQPQDAPMASVVAIDRTAQ